MDLTLARLVGFYSWYGEYKILFNITPKMGLALMGGNFLGVNWMEREANYLSPS